MRAKLMIAGAVMAMGWHGATATEAAAAPVAQVAIAGQAQSAEELYREGRRLLNQADYRAAARNFRRLRAQFDESEYVGDSFYWEAFALQRTGSRRDLERALELLDQQAGEYPGAATRGDAPALRVQIQGALANRGDGRAAQGISERASQRAERDRQAAQRDRERAERDRERAERQRGRVDGVGTAGCDTEDQELRAMALNALLNMNADRARPILMEVLETRDSCSVELRRQAVFLVSQKMDEEAVDILLDLAHRNPDPDQEVREQAVFWLSQVGGPEAAAALIDILRSSEDRDVQENAIFALSQHGSPEAWDVLREYAERADAPVDLRENAIFWLGQAPGGGDYLRGLYARIDEAELRENIIFGVSQSGTEEDAAWLLDRALDDREDIEVRKNALFWAGQMGMEIDQLADLYERVDDSEMKEQIIFVVSQSSDKHEAVTQLMAIAENEDDKDLRENAVFWLGQMDDDRVAEFLLKLIRSGGGTIR